jgi:integrase
MGEQVAIRWGDIDWISRMVHIRQSAPAGGAIASTRSGRHRAVPLTPELGRALRARRCVEYDDLLTERRSNPI